MTINIDLSKSSIKAAIRQLEDIKDKLDEQVNEVVSILVKEGAEVANKAYDGMAHAGDFVNENEGVILVSGDDATQVIIAEFGAGQATMPYLFENPEPVPIEEGAYSRDVGTQEYYKFGSWHFGGKYYTEVPARHGLLDAREYIKEHAERVAQEVIKL